MSLTGNPTETPIRIGVFLLTLATAIVHLQLNFPDPVFILNGLGYLTLLTALYLPIPPLSSRRFIVRRVLIGFTALTLFLWILFGERSFIGYTDKVIEVALIVLLVIDERLRRPSARS